jgi:hypothetical protein
MLLNFLVHAQTWPSLNEVKTPSVVGTGSIYFGWDVREFTLPPESWTCAGGANRRIYAKAVRTTHILTGLHRRLDAFFYPSSSLSIPETVTPIGASARFIASGKA